LAFLRFTRDKRGIENFYLVQPITNRRGKVRPRVLYWFRSPPDVKVGREPFDQTVRRALEAQHPDVDFDWRAIVETPIPSADAENWRARRRPHRAAKHAAAEEESADAANGEAIEVPAPIPEQAPIVVDGAGLSSATQPAEAPRRGGDVIRKRRRRRRPHGGRDNGAPPAATSTGSESAGD
jgi:hypothetical protein